MELLEQQAIGLSSDKHVFAKNGLDCGGPGMGRHKVKGSSSELKALTPILTLNYPSEEEQKSLHFYFRE